MSEALDFESKVQGLLNYHKALEALDPRNPEHNELANPNFFYYSEGFHASHPLAKVKKGVLYDMECQARSEYHDRGLHSRELKEETPEQKNERADILAVMTSPLSTITRVARARLIADFLEKVRGGEQIDINEYTESRVTFEAKSVEIDNSRRLFAVFRNSHISSRVLSIQYDMPEVHGLDEPAERALSISIPILTEGSALSRESVTV